MCCARASGAFTDYTRALQSVRPCPCLYEWLVYEWLSLAFTSLMARRCFLQEGEEFEPCTTPKACPALSNEDEWEGAPSPAKLTDIGRVRSLGEALCVCVCELQLCDHGTWNVFRAYHETHRT